MSVALYDKALLEKLQAWTQDTDMHIYGLNDTQRLFEVIASNSDSEQIKLPIVCLRRNGSFEIQNINKRPLSFDGRAITKTSEYARKLNAVPIKIDYQLDIYCKQYEEADEYARDFILNIINYPNLKVTIPYHNEQFVHNATLRVAEEIEDNSDIPERLVAGQFTRLTLNVNIDDAYLWDIKQKTNKSLENVYVKTNN